MVRTVPVGDTVQALTPPEFPGLGAVTDGSSVVGVLAGTGLFTAPAMRTYAQVGMATASALASETAARTAADAALAAMAFAAVLQPTGDTTDRTAAIQSAVNASLCVIFAPGNYTVAGTVTLRPGSYILGGGRGTVILAGATGGYAFAYTPASLTRANIRLARMTIQATASGVSGIRTVLASDVSVEDVQFLGCALCISADRGYYHRAVGCVSRPVATGALKAGGFNYSSSSDATFIFYPVMRDCAVHTEDELGVTVGAITPCVKLRRAIGGAVENFVAERLNLPSGSLVDGIVVENDCQGCKITGGVTYGARFGVVTQPGTGVAVAPGYLSVLHHDVDFFSGVGIYIAATPGAASADILIRDCLVTAPQGASTPCIRVDNTLRATVQNNTCDQYGAIAGTGVFLLSVNTGVITGNVFNNLTTGMVISGAAVVNTQILDNSFVSNTSNLSGDLTGGGTGTNRVRDNLGVQPASIPVVTPAVPTSGVYIPNTFGIDVMVFAYGGNGVTFGLNGINTGILFSPIGAEPKGGSVFLPAGGSVSMSYASAPTWVWIPV